ncbi:hypothetical protein I9G15_000594 [Salmonella enterica]|nr:hypothetical protein [Salmonella enterica]
MMETFFSRCERVLCFSLLFLGAAALTLPTPGWLWGSGVIACVTLQYLWNPGKLAINAHYQAFRYQQLRDEFDRMTRDEFLQKMRLIERDDSPAINALLNPARCRAYIALGWKQVEKLTFWERCVACIAGGIPY